MRWGNYEISILTDSKVLNEVVLSGKTYVYSEPGKEYHVNIAVYRDPITRKFPATHLRFGLYVDGIDVQYWKRLDLSQDKDLPSDINIPVCVKFWGFKENVSELRSFVFTTPTYIEENAAIPTAAETVRQMGTLRVVIFEARVTTGDFHNQQAAKKVITQSSINGGNVKLLDQASLITGTGQQVSNTQEVFAPLQRWENLSKQPLATIDLYYHSRQMIDILSRLMGQRMAERERVSTYSTSGKRDASVLQMDSSDDEDSENNHHKLARLSTYPSSSEYGVDSREAVEEEVVVIQKTRVAPMLDLTDEHDTPQWSAREIR